MGTNFDDNYVLAANEHLVPLSTTDRLPQYYYVGHSAPKLPQEEVNSSEPVYWFDTTDNNVKKIIRRGKAHHRKILGWEVASNFSLRLIKDSDDVIKKIEIRPDPEDDPPFSSETLETQMALAPPSEADPETSVMAPKQILSFQEALNRLRFVVDD